MNGGFWCQGRHWPRKSLRRQRRFLCGQRRSAYIKKESKKIAGRETYSTSFVIAHLGGATHVPPPPLSCFEYQVDIPRGSEVATRSVDVWLDGRKDVCLFQGM